MAIKEIAVVQETDNTINRDGIVMAFAILTERIRGLPKEDRDDLFELVMELPQVIRDQDQEELQRIWIAMREIMADCPSRVRAMELAAPGPRKSLKPWLQYISTRIKACRKAAKLTQDELAEKSGLPQSHISRLEAGRHSPSRVTLEKIAKALDIPLGTFDPSAPLATEAGSE